MKSFFLMSLLILSISAQASVSWISAGEINLKKVTSSHELGRILSQLTTEMIEDGIDEEGNHLFCAYQAQIIHSHVEDDTFHFNLGYSFYGDAHFCKDGRDGVFTLWEMYEEVENVVVEEPQSIEE